MRTEKSSKFREFLFHDLVDAFGDSRVEAVHDVDGLLDLLPRVQRRPERGDGEETVESELFVGAGLHPLDGLEFGLELCVVAENRLVVALSADFVAEIHNVRKLRQKDTREVFSLRHWEA